MSFLPRGHPSTTFVAVFGEPTYDGPFRDKLGKPFGDGVQLMVFHWNGGAQRLLVTHKWDSVRNAFVDSLAIVKGKELINEKFLSEDERRRREQERGRERRVLANIEKNIGERYAEALARAPWNQR